MARKVVKKVVVEALKAIETLAGNWHAVDNQGYTIALTPAEVPHNNPGLDLPIAVAAGLKYSTTGSSLSENFVTVASARYYASQKPPMFV